MLVRNAEETHDTEGLDPVHVASGAIQRSVIRTASHSKSSLCELPQNNTEGNFQPKSDMVQPHMNPHKVSQFEPSTSHNKIMVLDLTVKKSSPDSSLSYENQNETAAVEATKKEASVPQIHQEKTVVSEVPIGTGRESKRSKRAEQELIETQSTRGPSLEQISATRVSAGWVLNEPALNTTNTGRSTSRDMQNGSPT